MAEKFADIRHDDNGLEASRVSVSFTALETDVRTLKLLKGYSVQSHHYKDYECAHHTTVGSATGLPQFCTR